MNEKRTEQHGAFDPGCIFVRNSAVLDEWEHSASNVKSDCCQHQLALDVVAERFQSVDMSCGMNVGVYQLRKGFNEEGRDLFDRVTCSHDRIMFKDCEIAAMKFSIDDEEMVSRLRPYLTGALTKCNSPLRYSAFSFSGCGSEPLLILLLMPI